MDAFMARAESSISGTKYSSHSKRRPTSSMAGTRYPVTMVSGATPAATAASRGRGGGLPVSLDHGFVQLLQIRHAKLR